MSLVKIKRLRIITKATDVQVRLRICSLMKKIITDDAMKQGRSLNNHILYLIKQGLESTHGLHE